MPRGNPKTIKNFRLTDDAIGLLERLSAERGISQAAVIEQAVRDFARRESGSAPAEANAEANAGKNVGENPRKSA